MILHNFTPHFNYTCKRYTQRRVYTSSICSIYECVLALADYAAQCPNTSSQDQHRKAHSPDCEHTKNTRKIAFTDTPSSINICRTCMAFSRKRRTCMMAVMMTMMTMTMSVSATTTVPMTEFSRFRSARTHTEHMHNRFNHTATPQQSNMCEYSNGFRPQTKCVFVSLEFNCITTDAHDFIVGIIPVFPRELVTIILQSTGCA